MRLSAQRLFVFPYGIALGLLLIAMAVIQPANAIAGPPYNHTQDIGHADAIAVHLHGTDLELEYEDATHTFWEPQEVLMIVKDPEAFVGGPFSGDFAFLGSGDAWILPQVQNNSILWPGVNTEALLPADWTTGVDISLDAVSGPGDFFLFVDGSLGNPPTVIWDSTSLPSNNNVAANVHVHYNWAFTQLGLYNLTVSVSGTHQTLGALQSVPFVYDICVGDPLNDCGIDLSSGGGSGGGSFQPCDPTQGPCGDIDISADVVATGALTLSVAPGGLSLSPAGLVNGGTALAFHGHLPDVTVIDDRTGNTIWNVSGIASPFVQAADPNVEFGSFYMGWLPEVHSYNQHHAPHAGPLVDPGTLPGEGLDASRELADADQEGRGTAVLSADMDLEIPTSTEEGSYSSTLTLTLI